MSKIVDSEELCVFAVRSRQSPRSKKVHQYKSTTKSVLFFSFLFHIHRAVQRKIILEGQTVNAKGYCEVLRGLKSSSPCSSGCKHILNAGAADNQVIKLGILAQKSYCVYLLHAYNVQEKQHLGL